MSHWKIVRDRNQEHFSHVISGEWRTSPDPVAALRKKLGEEYSEYCENGDPGELYDIADVVEELMTLTDQDGDHGRRHLEKVRKYGTFSRHAEWTPVPGDR